MPASKVASGRLAPSRSGVGQALADARLRIVATSLALVAGLTAQVDADAARWFGFRGLECLLGSTFGPHVCPGCGLVRSVASTLQGNAPAGFAFHPAGPFLVLLGCALLVMDLAVVYQASELAWQRSVRASIRVIGVAALAFGWILRWTLSS